MIKSIYLAADKTGNQQAVDKIHVVTGKGIIGDRNFDLAQWPGQNLTLVEAEAIAAYNQDFGQQISEQDTRRNLVTEGVRLNALVGKEFQIGKVRLKGVEFCEPCSKLGKLLATDTLSEAQVVKAWLHKGGLRADVLSDGDIAVGMTIQEVNSDD